jgi:precorrin-4 methylase
MGKPKIISADNEIINALYENGVLYQEFEGITLFRTSAHELNKNAIVERMIRTLKQYLVDILMTYIVEQLHSAFLTFRTKIIKQSIR